MAGETLHRQNFEASSLTKSRLGKEALADYQDDGLVRTHFIEGPYGGQLMAQTYGHQDTDRVVWFLPGSPGCSDDPALLMRMPYLYQNLIKVVVVNRDGYWGSTPVSRERYPDGRVKGTVENIKQVARTLNLPMEYFLGRSGGGRYALECRSLPGVKAVCAMATMAPLPALGDSWYDDMPEFNRTVYKAAEKLDTVTVTNMLIAAREDILSEKREGYDPAATGWSRREELTTLSHKRALLYGADGWIQDTYDATSWTLRNSDEGNSRTLIIDADKDLYVPPQHGEWLADHIAGAERQTVEGTHGVTMLLLPTAINWLLNDTYNAPRPFVY